MVEITSPESITNDFFEPLFQSITYSENAVLMAKQSIRGLPPRFTKTVAMCLVSPRDLDITVPTAYSSFLRKLSATGLYRPCLGYEALYLAGTTLLQTNKIQSVCIATAPIAIQSLLRRKLQGGDQIKHALFNLSANEKMHLSDVPCGVLTTIEPDMVFVVVKK